jgi:NAD-dependent dihydropyrimidine dehydrogenase PreA subunit
MMAQRPVVKIVASWVGVVLFAVIGSWIMMGLWGGPVEKAPASAGSLVITEGMTLKDFAQANRLPDKLVQKAFSLRSAEGLTQTIQATGLTAAAITDRVNKVLAFAAEEGSKNWVKIAAKFACWAVVLLAVFFLLKNRKTTPVLRKRFLLGSVALFGVILGSDPSPMGTVKDAVVLLGKSGIIFPPRMVALTAMLLFGTLLANKLLCSWGCQFGTLQDFLFRLGRDAEDRKGILPQVKIPFAVSNGIRFAVFAVMTAAAFLWAVDLIGLVDPFKIFNPAMLGTTAVIFIAGLLVASLFVYRPWCHLLCPFGLVGWLVEKVSLWKIQVDYDTCIACKKCAAACPSTVMGAILTREKTIPDCFACGTCLETCPTRSIRFARGRRAMPPAGKFTA